MKIHSVKNVNFQGQYINKSNKNDGSSLTQYRPYSWEVNQGKFKMAAPAELNLFSSSIPDNEIICTKQEGSELNTDIHGKVVKTRVTELPAMTREESLKVRSKKYDKFLSQKEALKLEMEKQLTHVEGRKKYLLLLSTINMVKISQKFENMEAEILEKARKKGALIDISRRDVHDPNRDLMEALKDVKSAKNKLIALPHKTISVKSMLEAIGENTEHVDVPQKALSLFMNKLVICLQANTLNILDDFLSDNRSNLFNLFVK